MSEQDIVAEKGQGKIAKALAAAQSEMHNPLFDSDNPFFKSKYASLAAIRNACIPMLAKHGIATIQYLTANGKDVSCETSLIHESGESITGPAIVLPAGKLDAQGIGSAATYARRYSLQAVVGIVGDADDDGNAATVQTAVQTAVQQPKSKGKAKATDELPEFTRELTVITDVHKITKKGSQFRILGDGDIIYTTLHEIFATLAKSAKEAGLKVEILHRENIILNIKLVEPAEETQEEFLDGLDKDAVEEGFKDEK